MAVFPNGTTLSKITRRRILTGAAASLAGVVPALPALGSEPDADLLALKREWDEAQAAFERAVIEQDERDIAADEAMPEPPLALTVKHMTTGTTRLITEDDIEFRTAFAGKNWAAGKRALLEQHKEVMRSVRAAHGCPEAEAAVEAITALIDGIEAAILAIPAQGITGVLVKMSVSRNYSSEIGDHAGIVLQSAYEDAERLAGWVNTTAVQS